VQIKVLAKIRQMGDKDFLYKGYAMLNEEETNTVINRLKNHPEILESIKDLLDITEGGIERADDAEFALIPEVRGLGKKCLHDWAKKQNEAKDSLDKDLHLRHHSKKK
jgi:hypothetical protein